MDVEIKIDSLDDMCDWTTNVYGKKWTTKEILHDCISVINQIIKINKGEKDEQN